jgi:hypothetical protein
VISNVSAAWQAALAAEHQAVFGYSLLGPHLATSPLRVQAGASQDAHVALRNATAAALLAAGETPVRPQADYPLLYPVASSRAALALAVRLETACATAWRYLYAEAAVGSGRPQIRSAAQQALTASAVRAAQWRRSSGSRTPTVAFPGI